MYISKLAVRNYRNFKNSSLQFHSGINTIIGENGSSKTNIVHALRLLIDESLPRKINFYESDFNRSIEWKGHWIIVQIEFADLDPSEECQAIAMHKTGAMEEYDENTGSYSLMFRPNELIRKALFEYSESADKTSAGLSEILDNITLNDYELTYRGRGNIDFSIDENYMEYVGDFENIIFPNPEILQEDVYGTRLFGYSIPHELSCTFIKALRDVESDLRSYRDNPLLNLLRGKEKDITVGKKESIEKKVSELNKDISELNEVKTVSDGISDSMKQQFGAMAQINNNVFIPPVKDVHFNATGGATLIAEDFVVRGSQNGGSMWELVKPVGGYQYPIASYNKVWTAPNGSSLLFGNGNTLLHTPTNSLTTTAFSVSDVQAVAAGTDANNVFFVDGNEVKKVMLNNLSVSTLHTPVTPFANPVNGLYVFSNGDHIVVGDGGLYHHFDIAGTEFSYSTGLPSSDFNALIFTDHLNGVIVGDGGVYYRATSPTITPSGYLSATNWQSVDLDAADPLGVTGADIYTVAAASATDLVIGGVNPIASANAPYPYVRRIYDASGRYTQKFYYDRLGRIVVSRNARQEDENKYSYSLYDALGRVYEAGEKTENDSIGELHFNAIFGTLVSGLYNARTIDDAKLNAWVTASGARKEVTRSYYDTLTITGLPSVLASDHTTQRHRILHVTYEPEFDGNDQTFDHATHFRYDIHGNVKTLVQDNKKMETDFPSLATQRFKQLDYAFDLVSGNVHRMSVQNGEADQWHHAYIYDADNRIRKVYTNTGAPLTEIGRLTQDKENELLSNSDWQNDAQYYYYNHGPLARVEIGQNNLQGLDYYYNLQGWLKGVNSSVLDSIHDPGKDSDQAEINALFAKDVFGFGLSYFQNDYTAISGATPIAQVNGTSHAATNSADLYNGNIRYMQTSITHPETKTAMPMLNAYSYDQLNRINESKSYEAGLSSNVWNPTSYANEYYNAFSFDPMGNIGTQKRHLRDGTQIEDMTYRYQNDANGKLLRNRLYHINDAIASNVDSTDIDDMGTFEDDPNLIETANNYVRDKSGRLVKNKIEEIDTIIWTATNRVKEIWRTPASNKKNIIFDYDAMGNQIAKHIYNNQTDMLEYSTYYILDAQGNQLSMYEHKVDTAEAKYYLKERSIYGSSRLGISYDTLNMFAATPLPSYGFLGNRNYELTDHRNNVYTVISDQVYPLSSDNTTIDAYEVGIISIADYSPYNVQLDGRTIERVLVEIPDTSGSTPPFQPAPVVAEIYHNEFNSPTPSGSTYTGTVSPLDANLSNTEWTTTASGGFTSYSGVSSTATLAVDNATPDTTYLNLEMDVASGYELDVTSYSFYNRRSSTGYTNYQLVVNGIVAGNGTVGTSLASTGTVNVANTIAPQTGTVNVVIKLFGGSHGSGATYRMDNFILSGYTKQTGVPVEETLYTHLFNDSPNASPYTTTPNTLHADLSGTQWVSSVGDFDNYTGVSSSTAIAISTATPDTSYLTLSMDVASGKTIGVSSYSFYHRNSSTGYTNYQLLVNGINVGTGTIPTTLTSTGTVNVANAVAGLSGTVNVVLKLFGGTHGSTGTFRMDNFVLHGYSQDEVPLQEPSIVRYRYRYSVQGQEHHDEILGKGNYINYKYRGYDPRIGRLDWCLDPLAGRYSYNSPYAFSENRVIDGVELEGLEFSKRISKSEFQTSLNQLLEDPISINQGGAGTCVIAAITFIWIDADKAGFEKALHSLYNKGQAQVNNFLINPDPQIFYVHPDNSRNSMNANYRGSVDYETKFDRELDADWMILTSVQNTLHPDEKFYGYGKGANSADGNLPKDTENLMKNLLGYDIVHRKWYDNKDDIQPEKILNNLDGLRNDGFNIVMSVRMSFMQEKLVDYASNIDLTGHAITYLGNLKIGKIDGKKTFSFDVQSWGKTYPLTMYEQTFIDFYKGAIWGKDSKKENNSTE